MAILTGPRVTQAMAADGLLWKPMAALDAKRETPSMALWVQAVLAGASPDDADILRKALFAEEEPIYRKLPSHPDDELAEVERTMTEVAVHGPAGGPEFRGQGTEWHRRRDRDTEHSLTLGACLELANR